MLSVFRRASDFFLRIVTPPRHDLERVDPFYDAFGDLDAAVGGRADRYMSRFSPDHRRRLGYWPGEERRPDFVRAYRETGDDVVEWPWNFNWNRLPKRSAGPGFSREDYRAARDRAREVCRATIGEESWQRLHHDGYLDVPSACYPGVCYRLRVGRRVQVLCDEGIESPWYYQYLCINPVYPLPEYEFFAQLFLYLRDQEDEVLRVAAPQPWDQTLGRTF